MTGVVEPPPDFPLQRIERQAGWVALAVFAGVGAIIYAATELLARWLGYDVANTIMYLPAFFAVLVIGPADFHARRWLIHHHCATHGGHVFVPLTVSWMHCTRCGEAVRADKPRSAG